MTALLIPALTTLVLLTIGAFTAHMRIPPAATSQGNDEDQSQTTDTQKAP